MAYLHAFEQQYHHNHVLQKGRSWLCPFCCYRIACDCIWHGYEYLQFSYNFCLANKLLSFWREGSMNLCQPDVIQTWWISGMSPMFHVSGIIWQLKYFKMTGIFVHIWPTGYMYSWHVPEPNIFVHLCNFLHLIYSPLLQAVGDIKKLFLSPRKEPYVFQHCSVFFSGDFIVQITHQQLGSFLVRSDSFSMPASWFTGRKILSGWFLKTICFA